MPELGSLWESYRGGRWEVVGPSNETEEDGTPKTLIHLLEPGPDSRRPIGDRMSVGRLWFELYARHI
jgi:hypothetical protein